MSKNYTHSTRPAPPRPAKISLSDNWNLRICRAIWPRAPFPPCCAPVSRPRTWIDRRSPLSPCTSAPLLTAQNPEADVDRELLQDLGLAAQRSVIKEGQNVAAHLAHLRLITENRTDTFFAPYRQHFTEWGWGSHDARQ